MCLEKIMDEVPKITEGYKVFMQVGDELYPQYKSNGNPLPVNVWLKESDYRKANKIFEKLFPRKIKIDMKNKYYPIGFHVYVNENYVHNDHDAKTIHVLRKVQVKDIVAHGTQWGGRNCGL